MDSRVCSAYMLEEVEFFLAALCCICFLLQGYYKAMLHLWISSNFSRAMCCQ
jgi:hypothetical protein